MLFRRLVGLAVALAAGILIATTALADLRSPEGTVELGVTIADDPAVRALVASTVVDTLVEDAGTSSRDVALFLPLLRPLLVGAVDAALDAPAGRAALAATLTDASRQLTFDGPIVLDLRDAVLAAADAAPEPLATLARTAVERGAVGIVVLGDAGDVVDDGAREVPDDATLARVGGLAASTATALAWALLGIVLLAATAPGGGTRPARLRAAGGALLLVGAPSALLLRLAPDQVVDRVAVRLQDTAAEGASGGGELLAAVLPTIADGVAGLLGRTSVVAIGVAGAGVVLLAAGVALRAAPGRR
jgi:hypothetical protein